MHRSTASRLLRRLAATLGIAALASLATPVHAGTTSLPPRPNEASRVNRLRKEH